MAIGAIAYSELDMKAKQAATAKHPKQNIIEDVLREHYSHIDMIHTGKEMSPPCLEGEAYKRVVAAWCKEFDVPFNPAICILISNVNNLDKTTSRDHDDIAAEIKEMINIFDEKQKKAQVAYDSMPWHSKVNWVVVIWTIVALFALVMKMIQ